MKRYFYSLISTTLLLIISACHKHEIIIAPADLVTASDIDPLFKKNLEDIKVIEPFEAENGLRYALLNKAEITIYPRCLIYEDNTLAKGKSELTFIEIYDRGTMLITNKPTTSTPKNLQLNTATNNENKYISATVGQFYIVVTQNGKKLIAEEADDNECYFNISIPKSLTDITKIAPNDLKLYTGQINQDNNISWQYSTEYYEELYLNEEIIFDKTQNKYILASAKYGWVSAIDALNNKYNFTTVSFEKPNGLNDSNSRIFVALEGINSALGDHNTLIPEGEKAHYILTVGNGDNFKYAIKQSQIIAKDQTITFTASELKDATTSELKDIVNGLP